MRIHVNIQSTRICLHMKIIMYVVLFWGMISTVLAKQKSEDENNQIALKMRVFKNELESLRFTIYLWSCFNVGLIIILIYLSWRTYKRQEKMTEWRV